MSEETDPRATPDPRNVEALPPCSPAPLRIAVVGGGPGGLCAAIALARRGHHVVVFEKLATSIGKPTVYRDRSYPVDATARGMAALGKLGTLAPRGPLRLRMLPFFGHIRPTDWRPMAMAEPGLIGTRDDFVAGLLEHVAEAEAARAWPGRVTVFHEVPVAGVDLATRSVTLADGAPCAADAAAAAAAPFALVVGADGKGSRVRDSAARQDAALTVRRCHSRDGEELYKTYNLDLLPPADADARLPTGFLHPSIADFPPCISGCVPAGGALGICPAPPRLVAKDGEAGEVRVIGPAAEPGYLRARLAPELMKFVTPEEEEAFDTRPWSDAGSGSVASQLVAGDCVALVGDAAASPPPPGQGINHALEMASRLDDALASARDDALRAAAASDSAAAPAAGAEPSGAADEGVVAALAAFDGGYRADHEAYTFLGAGKTPLQSVAIQIGMLLGLHPKHGPQTKETLLPYSELTCIHKYV